MPSLEFEIPLKYLNGVMDVVDKTRGSLEWVYYNEHRESAVVRFNISPDILNDCLVELAGIIGEPTEVTVVEKSNGTTINEAFIFALDTVSGRYPVMVLFEYSEKLLTPSAITVGTKKDSPNSILDDIMELEIGRVDMSKARYVGTSSTPGSRFIHLKA